MSEFKASKERVLCSFSVRISSLLMLLQPDCVIALLLACLIVCFALLCCLYRTGGFWLDRKCSEFQVKVFLFAFIMLMESHGKNPVFMVRNILTNLSFLTEQHPHIIIYLGSSRGS
jgi:hypothetical protein